MTLDAFFREHPRFALAFSGGTDSAYLLWAAVQAGCQVQPYFVKTPFQPAFELEDARRLAGQVGLPLTVLPVAVLDLPQVVQNPPDRCYLCKREMFSALCRWAREQGISQVLDGTNADDRTVYRPGLRALAELGVQSPLADCGLTKAEVRALAAERGLSAAGRPSSPCMATRLPYGAPLDLALLRRLEQGEEWVRSQGIGQVRLRFQEPVLRIEVAPEEMEQLWRCRREAVRQLKGLGFSYIALDLEGFRSGSMDEGRKE